MTTRRNDPQQLSIPGLVFIEKRLIFPPDPSRSHPHPNPTRRHRFIPPATNKGPDICNPPSPIPRR